MRRIAIFASGNGSNAENIVKYLKTDPDEDVMVSLVVTNRKDAPVIARCERLGVPVVVVPKAEFNDSSVIMPLLKEYGVELIVLAGFLLMIPDFMLRAYEGRIVNIHPSLLPHYGGKGMWGHHVHEAVVAAGERVSGITVHLVSEVCDGGEIIFQAALMVAPEDTAETLETRIHALEHHYFPQVVARMARKLPQMESRQ